MLPVPSTTPLSTSQPCANLSAYAPVPAPSQSTESGLVGAAWSEQLRITYREGSQTPLGRTSADLSLVGGTGPEAEQCQSQASHCWGHGSQLLTTHPS